MNDTIRWSARRIVNELTTPGLRREIAIAFWRNAEPHARAAAIAHLARAMNFRTEFLRKAPVEKKADWLLQRSSIHELHEALEMALMLHHTTSRNDMMAAFLDQWGIPHESGTIEAEEYSAPDEKSVREAVEALRARFDLRDIVIYLATAGLLMESPDSSWRAAAWPVVDELVPELESAE